MTDPTPSPPAALTAVQQQLRAVAQVLHDAQSLNAEARAALAEFMEELSNTLDATPDSSKDLAHLTECTAHLLQAAHQSEETEIPEAVRGRFEQAVLGVQTKFPNV